MYKYIHDEKLMEEILTKFMKYAEEQQTERGDIDPGRVSFRTGYLAKCEQKKLECAYIARKTIGRESEGIAERTIRVLETIQKDYGFMFVHWYKINVYKEWVKKNPVVADHTLYELFTASDESVEAPFEQMITAFGHRYYDLMSTLLFIKDPKRYLPCRSDIMKTAFSNLGLDTSCLGDITLSRYRLFIDQIRDIQKYLTINMEPVDLIDAHSYVWMLSEYTELREYVFSTE